MREGGRLSRGWWMLTIFWLVVLAGAASLAVWLELAPAGPSSPVAEAPPAPPAPGPPAAQASVDRRSSPAPAPAPAPPRDTIDTAPASVPAWRAFSRRIDESDRRPRIAVLVVGLGMSESATMSAIERLPGPISLAFSPYGLQLDAQIAAARAAGHEVLIGLPMEPTNFPLNDPGPRALMTGNPPPENAARLEWVLSRGSGFVGATNAASAVLRGERFAASAEAMRPVLQVLRDRGLLYIEARPGERAPDMVPARSADLVIDERLSRSEIDARLAELERLARERGVALGISGPSPLAVDRLAAWAVGVHTRDLMLAPVSAVVVSPSTVARP